jgi:hypothetical protein
VIIWLNGTFGAGKTSAAVELAGILPGARQFDPEWVGYMLRANLADQNFTDFQQLPSWRTLVPVVMADVDSTALSVRAVAELIESAVRPLLERAQKASSGISIGSSEVASAISRSVASRGSTVAAKNPAAATLPR